MTYEQLRMLVMIVETGSIIAAAERMYKTQPTVSMAMKKLEEEYELTIFDREQYRATLTPVGKALYEKAKMVLEQTNSFEKLGRQLGMGYEPELDIVIDIVCPFAPILNILKDCQREYPNTKLNLTAESMGGTTERLMDGNANLAIAPWFGLDSKVESIDFTEITGGPMASPTHPAALINGEISIEEMKKFVQIIVRDSSRHSKKISHSVLDGDNHWTVADFFTKKQIILAGLGWGGLPHHIVENELKSGELMRLNINSYPKWSGEIRVLRLLDQPVGPIQEQLWNRFKCFSSESRNK